MKQKTVYGSFATVQCADRDMRDHQVRKRATAFMVSCTKPNFERLFEDNKRDKGIRRSLNISV